MVRKSLFLLLLFIFSCNFPNRVYAQSNLDKLFADEMIKKIGTKNFATFTNEYEKRVNALRIYLIENKLPDEAITNINFILYYTRISSWVNANEVRGNSLKEAKDYLKVNSDRFIDACLKVFRISHIVARAMAGTKVTELLSKYRQELFEVVQNANIKQLIIKEEESINMRFGVTPSEFAIQYEKLTKITGSFSVEETYKLMEKFNRQFIEQNRGNAKFIAGLVTTCIGLGAIIGDAVFAPATGGLSSLSTSFGDGLFSAGVGIALLSFFE